jgi:DNA polymerase-3 subunit epsilon
MERLFDHEATPLAEVTFCVVDLETTGTDSYEGAITELGAVKVRGGEVLGTFQTLIDVGTAIPPAVSALTGITAEVLVRAPRVEPVLAAFAEFAGGCVLVGHNVGFDAAFLRAAFARAGWPPGAHPLVDTCALARRLLAGEADDCRLGTLAARYALPHQPTHRALEDAWATVDLLHLLLERAAAWGVVALDDLLALPVVARQRHATKLRLARDLDRGPGAFLFTGRGGDALVVGAAANVRAAVRAWFGPDAPRGAEAVRRELQAVHAVACSSELEAAVRAVRWRHRHDPRAQRRDPLGPRGRPYVVASGGGARGRVRLRVARVAAAVDGPWLGPFPSGADARAVVRALAVLGSWGAAALGRAVTSGGTEVLEPLRDRLGALAAAERYEEAAVARDELALVTAAFEQRQARDRLRASGTLLVRFPDGARAELRCGLLARAAAPGGPWYSLDDDAGDGEPSDGPPTPAVADELALVSEWLAAHQELAVACPPDDDERWAGAARAGAGLDASPRASAPPAVATSPDRSRAGPDAPPIA